MGREADGDRNVSSLAHAAAATGNPCAQLSHPPSAALFGPLRFPRSGAVDLWVSAKLGCLRPDPGCGRGLSVSNKKKV